MSAIGLALREIADQAVECGRMSMAARMLSWAHSVDVGADVATLRADARHLWTIERDPSDSRLLGCAWLAMGGATS